jgi:hypothetical protein
MPIERYDLSLTENGIFITANDLAMARCMKDAGFADSFPFVDRRNPAVDTDWRYGVWVRSQVARYGYGQVPPSPRGKLLRALNAKGFTPAAGEAYQACLPKLKQQGLMLPDLPDDTAGGPDAPKVLDGADPLDSDAAKAVVKEWTDCLRSRGVSPPAGDARWFPAGVTSAPLEEQIRVGLIDVGCKEEHRTVQRLADIEASYQQPLIERDEARLVQRRRELDALLDRSRKYIAGAPELSAG